MTDQARRNLVKGASLLSLAAAAGFPASGQAAAERAMGPAFGNEHSVVPLPFRPANLKGISEKLIQSHWENNYGGAVKALNLVRGRLQQALGDTGLPPYLYNGLKREQLIRSGSVILHEQYFANLGGNGSPGSAARSWIAAAFGTFDAWETEFRRIGQGLGGGSGWVMLGYNRGLNLLENSWMADHATAPVDTVPVLVLDMYEHAYHMDYGAAAAKYIDAFFANLQWEIVEERMSRLVGSA
jgi:Fe-Mn family superoxide dismutase